jgi:hypothetical protein
MIFFLLKRHFIETIDSFCVCDLKKIIEPKPNKRVNSSKIYTLKQNELNFRPFFLFKN